MSTKTLSRKVWLRHMERAIAARMPDEYPAGFARHLAEKREREGGYDHYISGRYGDDRLWEPVYDESGREV